MGDLDGSSTCPYDDALGANDPAVLKIKFLCNDMYQDSFDKDRGFISKMVEMVIFSQSIVQELDGLESNVVILTSYVAGNASAPELY